MAQAWMWLLWEEQESRRGNQTARLIGLFFPLLSLCTGCNGTAIPSTYAWAHHCTWLNQDVSCYVSDTRRTTLLSPWLCFRKRREAVTYSSNLGTELCPRRALEFKGTACWKHEHLESFIAANAKANSQCAHRSGSAGAKNHPCVGTVLATGHDLDWYFWVDDK